MENMDKNFGRKAPFRPDRPKNYTEKLKRLLENLAEKINREAEQKYGLEGLLNADCTIAMEGFSESGGGIYHEEEIKKHQSEVEEMEFDFSSARNQNVQEHYGVHSPEEVVKRWKENKMKEKNGQTEMAVTALLCKMLKDDFLVVRTASFDDYRHGVDNIILNKRTGEAICAFDEVHEGGQGERTKGKEEKIKKFAKKGGTEIAYGLRLEDGKLVRSKMKNIPVFFLGVKSEELLDLMANMDYNPDSEPTPVERETFSKLVVSLREQQLLLLNSPEIGAERKDKLKSLENLLVMLEHISSQAREKAGEKSTGQ